MFNPATSYLRSIQLKFCLSKNTWCILGWFSLFEKLNTSSVKYRVNIMFNNFQGQDNLYGTHLNELKRLTFWCLLSKIYGGMITISQLLAKSNTICFCQSLIANAMFNPATSDLRSRKLFCRNFVWVKTHGLIFFVWKKNPLNVWRMFSADSWYRLITNLMLQYWKVIVYPSCLSCCLERQRKHAGSLTAFTAYRKKDKVEHKL